MGGCPSLTVSCLGCSCRHFASATDVVCRFGFSVHTHVSAHPRSPPLSRNTLSPNDQTTPPPAYPDFEQAHLRAASNVTGENKTMHLDSAGLGCANSRGQCRGATQQVTTVTVDDLARSLGLLPEDFPNGKASRTEEDTEGARSLPPGKELVIVKIDVEGWEVAVIQGMRRVLEKGVVQLVVFETGSTWEDDRAAARGTSLGSVVADFARVGYQCFYIGVRFLHPISAPLEHEIYDENKQHRNVLCALSAPWLPGEGAAVRIR